MRFTRAGSCEKTWPALTVLAGTKVASAVPGVKGTSGTTKRPDGSAHVTWNYLPSDTDVPDRLGVVLCDNQDGCFRG
jgi:hypothetical protein